MAAAIPVALMVVEVPKGAESGAVHRPLVGILQDINGYIL
jgi:hypothetical protein